MIQRREFITLLGGAASWPFAARGQQGDTMRRVGVLMNSGMDDEHGQARLAAFLQGLQQLGWTEGRNLRLDVRWAMGADPARTRQKAAELLALAPEIILTATTLPATELRRATRSVPIVFAMVVDPVGAGIVESLPRPGGNITGFMQFEFSLAGKWLELLKQIAPDSPDLPFCATPAFRPGSASSPSSRPWHRRSAWMSSLSMCVRSAKLSVVSPHSHAPRTAV
jgi:ABC transporter substrate binding protein